ncbi:MAG TPA: hypothetical protein VNF51_02040 [Candidatus Paceibacterota bacterium]|nr:hypothetical protein [Candidatus Paceibacterota bacterium]
MNSRILPSLALLVAVGIFFAYVNPTWSGSIAAKQATIASDDQALAAATEYTNQQNQLAAARDAIDPTDLTGLTTLLPDSVDNVGLILDLNALAASSGLSLSSVDITSNTASTGSTNSGAVVSALPNPVVSPVGSVDLSLSAIGTYSAFKAFLGAIEKSERLLDVQDIVIKGSDTGVYGYQMTIRIYWLR